MSRSFEVTIPVLNEERYLRSQVETVVDFLFRSYGSATEWSLVIADNGSTDMTSQIARGLSEKFRGFVKYIRLEERGVGRALKASWRQSQSDIVGYLDLDLATDLSYLPQAISILSGDDYDLVYGTRLHKGAAVIGRSLKREITSRVFNHLVRSYLKVTFSDGMCGFKFLKRKIVDELRRNGAVSNGWFFATEVLVVSERLGYRMYELPVVWRDSRNSKVNILRLTKEYLSAMRVLKRIVKTP